MQDRSARFLTALAASVAVWVCLAGPIPDLGVARAQDREVAPAAADNTCAECHAGIEEMHPFAPVTCVQCHGGDPAGESKEAAHVQRRTRPAGDERVLGQTFDPPFLRFVNPGNLRVAAESCGPCHPQDVHDVGHSLHASTSGHLGDGLYENGVVGDRHPAYSVFSVRDGRPESVERPERAVRHLKQVPSGVFGGDPEKVSTHFGDLPRKACMQCHLWSVGRAVRGRAGMDGDYRSEGCSACHVAYEDDGLSRSRDRNIDHFEPGHPKEHRMVRFPTTQTCTRCHYGDASIGLSFRGLAQPVPGMPQTPDAPGLHRKRLNGVYYIEDPAATPADVHHQRGMHCADCHTREDVMGDGFLYKRMEDAVAIACESCHGTPDAYALGRDRRGLRLPHLERRPEGHFLRSRVTGQLHRVKQARDIVRPGSDDYNEKAALAMTADHGRLECYACHSGWSPNFFGFHFDRNEAFTQLDLLSGKRTAGRVTTQEKVFSTFKHYYLGWNSHGRIAPYMVGFSSMATVHAADGTLLLDQALPVTRAGLSGMTLIHHQTHTTTARARRCVECHRAPATFGRGSVNFRLFRDFLMVAGDTGLRTISVDRSNPADSALLSAAPVPAGRAVAVRRDRVSGLATHVYVGSAEDGLVVCDLEIPGFPRVAERMQDGCTDPQRMRLAASKLYVADGEAGLRVFDVSNPSQPSPRAHLPDLPAYDVFLDGNTLFVAAGPRGLAVVDVRFPEEPEVVLDLFDLNGPDTAPLMAIRVETLFQYSRPNREELEGRRSRPRNLATVLDRRLGMYVVDVTEPDAPRVISAWPGMGVRFPGSTYEDVALGTVYELGSEGGAIPSRERDLAFVLRGGAATQLVAIDLTEPRRPEERGGVGLAPGARSLRLARVYNPPFLQTYAVVAGEQVVQIVDVGDPAKPVVVASLPVAPGGYDVDLEEFPLDRTVDADGDPVMDVSHEDSRWLSDTEIDRALRVPLLGPREPETELDGEDGGHDDGKERR